MSSKLEKLQQERNRLNAQIQRLAARKQAEERKQQTRRDVLVGAFVRRQLAAGEAVFLSSEDRLLRLMDGWLTRDGDRAVFGLAPLPKPEKKPEAVPASEQALDNLEIIVTRKPGAPT